MAPKSPLRKRLSFASGFQERSSSVAECHLFNHCALVLHLAPPSKPNNLQVIDVTTRTVTLAWAPPTSTGGADLIGKILICSPHPMGLCQPNISLLCEIQNILHDPYKHDLYIH